MPQPSRFLRPGPDEAALDVEVTDMPGSAAQFAEKLTDFSCLFIMPGQNGQQGKKLHLGFDTADRGAKSVNVL
jgi:hypothetical protein